jgi:hypothetical protein
MAANNLNQRQNVDRLGLNRPEVLRQLTHLRRPLLPGQGITGELTGIANPAIPAHSPGTKDLCELISA